MDNREIQYQLDIVSALAERVIKRLWVLVIILTVLLFGSISTWIWYNSQYETVVVTQDVEQEAESGTNHFIGGDYYGETTSQNDG